MSNRQARIARKRLQRAGEAIYVHVKPTKRVLAPIEIITHHDGIAVVPHPSHREQRRRRFRYEQDSNRRPVTERTD